MLKGKCFQFLHQSIQKASVFQKLLVQWTHCLSSVSLLWCRLFYWGILFYIWSDGDLCSQTAFGLFESTGQPSSRASLSQSSQINSRNALRKYTLTSVDNGNTILSRWDRLHTVTAMFACEERDRQRFLVLTRCHTEGFILALYNNGGPVSRWVTSPRWRDMHTRYVAVSSINITNMFLYAFFIQCLLPQTIVLT